jgi:hypothetical protein
MSIHLVAEEGHNSAKGCRGKTASAISSPMLTFSKEQSQLYNPAIVR